MRKRRKTIEEILLLEYVSLTEIGILFDTSSHWIGRWLEALGLWVPCGKATSKARIEGLVNPIKSKKYDSGCPERLNTWHRAKTVAVLVAAGHKLKEAAHAESSKAVSKYVVKSAPKNMDSDPWKP